MVLVCVGRSSPDPKSYDSCCLMDLLTKSLLHLAAEVILMYFKHLTSSSFQTCLAQNKLFFRKKFLFWWLFTRNWRHISSKGRKCRSHFFSKNKISMRVNFSFWLAEMEIYSIKERKYRSHFPYNHLLTFNFILLSSMY